MKTIERMQVAVDAIKAVCHQHGVALVGACHDEGIYGEIEVVDLSSAPNIGDLYSLLPTDL